MVPLSFLIPKFEFELGPHVNVIAFSSSEQNGGIGHLPTERTSKLQGGPLNQLFVLLLKEFACATIKNKSNCVFKSGHRRDLVELVATRDFQRASVPL